MFILIHNDSFIASAAVRAEAGVNTCRLRRVDTVMKSVKDYYCARAVGACSVRQCTHVKSSDVCKGTITNM